MLKAVVAKYNAEELLSKRESVSHRIREELIARARQFHLIMDDVSITHLTFGHEFTKAIENKQVRHLFILGGDAFLYPFPALLGTCSMAMIETVEINPFHTSH